MVLEKAPSGVKTSNVGKTSFLTVKNGKTTKGASMGTRINIVISEDDRVSAVLFSNSSHSEVDAEQILRNHAAAACGPTELVSWLLAMTYPCDEGRHLKGERIFWLDTNPGDHEKVLKVSPYRSGNSVYMVVEELTSLDFKVTFTRGEQ